MDESLETLSTFLRLVGNQGVAYIGCVCRAEEGKEDLPGLATGTEGVAGPKVKASHGTTQIREVGVIYRENGKENGNYYLGFRGLGLDMGLESRGPSSVPCAVSGWAIYRIYFPKIPPGNWPSGAGVMFKSIPKSSLIKPSCTLNTRAHRVVAAGLWIQAALTS